MFRTPMTQSCQLVLHWHLTAATTRMLKMTMVATTTQIHRGRLLCPTCFSCRLTAENRYIPVSRHPVDSADVTAWDDELPGGGVLISVYTPRRTRQWIAAHSQDNLITRL